MDAAALEKILTVALTVSVGIAAAYGIIRFVRLYIRSRRTGNAPVESARATVYWKNPEPKQELLGRHSTWVYFVTFHTDTGLILDLYLTRADYSSLQEGDWGTLTWQADKFWTFEKEV